MNEFPRGWARAAQVPGKIRKRGLSWLARRIGAELRTPTTRAGRFLLRLNAIITTAMQTPARMLLQLLTRDGNRAGTVFAFIDLDVCPVTFDFVDFVLLATLDQRKKGLDGVHVVVVPGRHGGLREEEPALAAVFDPDARRWRLHNLCVQTFGLMPPVSGYTVCSSRAQAGLMWLLARHISPAGYTVSFPRVPQRRELMDRARAGEAVLPFLRSPPQAMRHVADWLARVAGGKRVVCITLRESRYGPERNSNVAAWIEFARGLDHSVFQPVFVMDTDAAMTRNPEEFGEAPVFREAPWNIWLRAALYETAWISLGILSGPTELCWYNHRCRYLLFSSPEAISRQRLELMVEIGFEIGRQFPFAGPWQRIVWENDNLRSISTAFERMRREIEAAEAWQGEQ